MSEERFTGKLLTNSNGEELGFTIYDNEKRLNIKDVVELLNNLHQENQQLKHYKLYEDNKRLQTIIADLKEENEKLRQKILITDKN